MLKTFQYRLYPTKAQETKLKATLDECRWLYNHLLEQRKTAWEERGERLLQWESQRAPGLILGVIAQRLVPIACGDCGGKGCDACSETGHRGRTGVFETVA